MSSCFTRIFSRGPYKTVIDFYTRHRQISTLVVGDLTGEGLPTQRWSGLRTSDNRRPGPGPEEVWVNRCGWVVKPRGRGRWRSRVPNWWQRVLCFTSTDSPVLLDKYCWDHWDLVESSRDSYRYGSSPHQSFGFFLSCGKDPWYPQQSTGFRLTSITLTWRTVRRLVKPRLVLLWFQDEILKDRNLCVLSYQSQILCESNTN